MAEIKGILSAGSSLAGALKDNGYTLPTASPTRLGGIKIGEGLSIGSDGVLNTVKQNTYSRLSLTHVDGAVNKSAQSPDDTIGLEFKPSFKIADIDGVIAVDLNFGSYLDDDKPMAGTAVKTYIDSVNKGLESELEDLEEWLANTYISENKYITSQTYEAETDENGYAAIPFSLEDNQIAYILINGLIAVEGKDYQITDNSIQLTNSEFTSGNDIVTFVIFNPAIDADTNKTISISSQIYEARTDSDGYAKLPFTYNNQIFYVFINGALASEKRDYQIFDEGIRLINSEFIFGSDVITFAVFTPSVNGAESESLNMSLKIYETQTDINGYASIPLFPKVILKNNDNSAVQVFINGLYAIEGSDYQIDDGSIQLTSSEYLLGNDVVAFAVFEAKLNGSSSDDITPISLLEIEEIINS